MKYQNYNETINIQQNKIYKIKTKENQHLKYRTKNYTFACIYNKAR